MRHVVASNSASALLPQGNMGGRFYERYSGGDLLHYPHGTLGPVQTLAFMQDGAGLQFTALDGKAQRKTFDTRRLDMKIWFRSPDEGRPGTANAPDYAVETHAPFDIGYPEMFPARGGVKESAEWMKGQRIFYMPYINGSIWDTNITSFAEALPSTAKDTDGAYYTFKCSNSNVLARMCPTTEL